MKKMGLNYKEVDFGWMSAKQFFTELLYKAAD